MRAELSREEKLNVLTHGVMAAAFIIWMCIGVPQTWAAQGTVAGVGILIFFVHDLHVHGVCAVSRHAGGIGRKGCPAHL